MKIKPITPGMVIHCPKEEDVKAVLEHLDNLGYEYGRKGAIRKNMDEIPISDDVIYYIGLNETLSWGFREFAGADGEEIKVTEFSDLIEPDDSPIDSPVNSDIDSPMSAVEVLEWLEQYGGTQVAEKVFGLDSDDYVIDGGNVLDTYSPQEIVDKITAYEATKAPKPVEIEQGYRCYIDKADVGRTVDEWFMWGVDEQTAKDDVIDKALKYTKETGEQVVAGVTFICRVKEGKS